MTSADQAERDTQADDYVRSIVDRAPPLTDAQAARIASILRGGDGR